MNTSPYHLVLAHNFHWNTLADVDCREKGYKRHLSSVLQEEHYNYFPEK